MFCMGKRRVKEEKEEAAVGVGEREREREREKKETKEGGDAQLQCHVSRPTCVDSPDRTNRLINDLTGAIGMAVGAGVGLVGACVGGSLRQMASQHDRAQT